MKAAAEWRAVDPQPDRMERFTALSGQVWMCAACGKTSRDRDGLQPIERGFLL
jgi:hypothetical protein